jgi:aminoglycoside phosphotransferase (APT) family kinase protein
LDYIAMFKDYDELIRYLLKEKWIAPANVVGGQVIVTNVSRRHCNLRVECSTARSLFLKQGIDAVTNRSPELGSVAYEAEVYRLLGALFGHKSFTKCLPALHAFARKHNLLILEGVRSTSNWADYFHSGGRFRTQMGSHLGRGLAALHRVSAAARTEITKHLGTAATPPWILSVPEPHHWIYLNSSTATRALLELIQQAQDLGAALAGFKKEWRYTCLIHGDLKWENLLVSTRAANSSGRQLIITDWELARLGDPRWDLGAALSEYIHCWLSSIPVAALEEPDAYLHLARFPLERMQPSIRALWRTYTRAMGFSDDELGPWLMRSVQYAGVRLVQRAFEQAQVESRLSASAVLLVQLCSNIVARPLEAAAQLLGIPLSKLPNYGN